MRIDSVYTSSFVFPNEEYPYLMPTSALCKGPDDTFGFALCTDSELNLRSETSHELLPHYFLIYYANTQQVKEHFTELNYSSCWRIQASYDYTHSTWIAAVDSSEWRDAANTDRISNKVLDFYELSNAEHTQWKRITSIETLRIFFYEIGKGLINGMEDDGKSLQAFWQHNDNFPLLMSGDFHDGLTRSRMYLTQWRSYPQHLRHDLGWAGFVHKTYIFDDAFLLFVCDCSEDTLQWHIRFTLFALDGEKITQTYVPDISFPSRRGNYAVADDLWDWLQPTMQIVSGPTYGSSQEPTCVAALQLRDHHPDKLRRETPYTYQEHTLPKFQGGLYSINCDGTIISQYRTRLGEKLNMCLCDDKIIAADFIDEQWRLWYWFPFDNADIHVASAKFPADVECITLLVMDQDYPQEVPHFWSIEEYETGIRVSLWDARHLRQVEQNVVDEFKLPQSYSGTRDLLRQSIVAYQDTLLLIGTDRTGHVQMFRFKANL